jgi:small multidrug resistance family-3 protein
VTIRAAALFAAAALAEIGGVFLIWRTLRAGAHFWQAIIGGLLLVGYGFLSTLQSDPHFGRVLAAYGGVFVAGSLIWGVLLDGFRPRPNEVIGACVCLVGVLVIMWGRG